MNRRQLVVTAHPWLCVVGVIVASLLILRADLAYNQTFDESAHIACGMEWLSLGTYDYETLHPPLARAATAVFLLAHGIRSQGHQKMAEEGTALLNTGGGPEHDVSVYRYNLLRARLGMLPFFWLACFLVYRFMRRHFGDTSALVAVVLFAFCPIVLAHASLATTDAPFMALFLLSLLAFERLLEKPSVRTGLVAGLCFGLAALSKFTELPFFFIAALILLAQYKVSGKPLVALVGPVLVGTILVCFLIWGTYHFSLGPFFTPATIYPKAEAKLARMTSSEQALFLKVRLPAPEFFRGLYGAFLAGQKQQRAAYLFGQDYFGGKWYFFPTVVLTKTPLALLILAVCGLVHVFSTKERRRSVSTAVILGGICGPFIIAIAGGINLGVRHVLPMYPFLAMLGAVGSVHLWQKFRERPVLRQLVLLLATWEVAACLLVAPQFLPYFNEAAMPFFGRILVDSDLDWGQDFYRLEARLRTVDPQDISYAYFGDDTIAKHQSAHWKKLHQGDRPLGWIAVSETLYQEHNEDYAWLNGQPYERIGRSIRMYHLQNPAQLPR